VVECPLSNARVGGRTTVTKRIAVVPLRQERSHHPSRQKAYFRLRAAAICSHQIEKK